MTCVRNGIQYILIRPTSMRYEDPLSAVLMVLKHLGPDSPGSPLVQKQAEEMMQSLPARLRAAFHRQRLQELQQFLEQFGLPNGIILVHDEAFEQRVDRVLTLIARQARQLRLVEVGIATFVNKIPKELYGIPETGWIMLPNANQSQSDGHKLQQRVQLLMRSQLHIQTSLLSKL